MTIVLMGSIAAKFHWPDFRPYKDVDVIATEEEAHELIQKLEMIKVTQKPGKWSGFVPAKYGRKEMFVEMALSRGTHKEMYDMCQNNADELYVGEIRTTCKVPSAELLYLTKRSHVVFPIHWRKNFLDHEFMKNKGVTISPEMMPLFERRVQETKDRLGFKDPDFDVDNEEFFRRSERHVGRIFSHDQLHEWVKFGDELAYLAAKEDLTKAALSPEKFWNLTHEQRILIFREEMIVLALERIVIPAMVKKEKFDPKSATYTIAAQLVYQFTPYWQRHFALDNFMEITKYDVNYVKVFLDKSGWSPSQL